MLLKVLCVLCLASLGASRPEPNPEPQVQYYSPQQNTAAQQQQLQYFAHQDQHAQNVQYIGQPAGAAPSSGGGGLAQPAVVYQNALPTQQFRVAAAPQALATYQPGTRVAGAIQAGQLRAVPVKKVRPAGGQVAAGGQQQELPEDYDPNPQYQFAFDVKDDEFTNYQNRKEERAGDTITGSYSVVDSDGYIRTVTYTADPVGGFKAEVVREPTDIVVKIPQPQLLQQQIKQPQYVLKAGPAQGAQQQPAGIRYATPTLQATAIPVSKAPKYVTQAPQLRVAAVRKIPAGGLVAGGQQFAYAAQPVQYQQQ